MRLKNNEIDIAARRLYRLKLPRRSRCIRLTWSQLREHEREYYRWAVRSLIDAAKGRRTDERRLDIKHGQSYSPEYRAWLAVKSRCLNPNCDVFEHYGARGIKIFEGWKNDFSSFYHHVGPRPSARHSLDRYPNNEGHYEPGNVRWATGREQQANRRNTAWVTVDGIKIPLSDAVRRLDLNYNAVWMCISRGATPEEAIAKVQRVPQRRRAAPCG
jgi:hypothetical protein